MVMNYLQKFGEANRADFDKLLLDKLSDALDEQKKANSSGNLLQDMRRQAIIERTGTKRWARARHWTNPAPEAAS